MNKETFLKDFKKEYGALKKTRKNSSKIRFLSFFLSSAGVLTLLVGVLLTWWFLRLSEIISKYDYVSESKKVFELSSDYEQFALIEKGVLSVRPFYDNAIQILLAVFALGILLIFFGYRFYKRGK